MSDMLQLVVIRRTKQLMFGLSQTEATRGPTIKSQVRKVDPVPALKVAAISTSGDRVHLPYLQIRLVLRLTNAHVA